MKPMLSGNAPENLSSLRFPVVVSPKLDGFRAMVIDGVVVSRNLKPIPNAYVQELFGGPTYEGYDGELIVGSPTDPAAFRNTSSGVTSRDGEPDVKFYVFDRLPRFFGELWAARFRTMIEEHRIVKVPHHHVTFAAQILDLETKYLEEGYEGVMIRDPNGLYKQGRSTTREGTLLKLKRFEDGEALVLGMEEKMTNENEATINALGHTERSSHLANLTPRNTMGALIVRDLKTEVEFNIGTGFSDEDRDWWWCDKTNSQGHVSFDSAGGQIFRYAQPERLVKYKFFPTGSKTKPRFPVYLFLRDKIDV